MLKSAVKPSNNYYTHEDTQKSSQSLPVATSVRNGGNYKIAALYMKFCFYSSLHAVNLLHMREGVESALHPSINRLVSAEFESSILGFRNQLIADIDGSQILNFVISLIVQTVEHSVLWAKNTLLVT